MMVNVPFTAPVTPPDTGASMSDAPDSASDTARARVASGSEELMSMMVRPRTASAATRSSTTDCTIAEFGSINTTTDAPSAAAAAVG